MKERLQAFLKSRFPRMDFDFGPLDTEGRRLSGVLIWQGFEDLDVAAQQDAVWNALRQEFGPETVEISTLVTMTPEQFEALRFYSLT
jgi:hypothetical protein